MNKPLLLSLAAATILGTNLSAESMYDRIQMMELQMKQMQQELESLKSQESKATSDEDGDEEEVAQANQAESDDEEDDDEEDSIEDQIAEIQENISDLNRNTNGNHLKFGVDYRFAIENLDYKMADGSKQKNDAFMTNRLWMNMNWAATQHLSFTGQLAYNKAFGQRTDNDTIGYNFENFDWIANENAYDDIVRVRSAYFFYKDSEFLGADIPWTFSVGRRPSTNGHLINLRDDDHAASPMGHSINVEFDGLSAKFGLENITGADGMYLKFCAGRGMSNASHKFTAAPYANDTDVEPNIDLIGLIFVPYDDGQYSINSQYYYASNLIDQVFVGGVPQNQFYTVGGLHSITANVVANGIGDGINDFLDDTIFFVSGAMSITDPNADQGMLVSNPGESKTGYSVWVGTQFPSLISEEGRWGLEYNHGTQYWRSITYAEDTNIGSKVAARGDAYEAYFTEPLVEDILSLQIRYTYIDYKYAGSNGFFGNTTGNAVEITNNMTNASNYVDKAQDIRFYLRYRY
ncbi:MULTISPECIES: DUF3373 family protein [Sulfurimonas]|uniref:DUF3373 family protein n=1 Tax=Sulfurimonas TaxID=202746 RepID=UPI0012654E49|nr:DUF3373 family protein [Sulfurimonas indica]